jgi:uncharacterized protein (DUF58 family)
MIVPRTGLLVLAGIVMVPAMTLWGASSAWGGLATGVLTVALFLTAWDATRSAARQKELGIDFPRLLRFTQGRLSLVEFHLLINGASVREVRFWLQSPPGVRTRQNSFAVTWPGATERMTVAWEVTPQSKGQVYFREMVLETKSPLGLWWYRRRISLSSEWRVYPNLQDERRQLAALFLRQGVVGGHAQRQVGKGRDFEKLREYVPGDDFNDIHWRATAKRGRPITKIFQLERTQEIYVILDAARLSAQAIGRGAVVLDHYVKTALLLGQAAEQQGDLFGLLAFADKPLRFVRAGSGQAHYGVCRDAIYALKPQIVSPDYDQMGLWVRSRLRKRSLLIFLTDVSDPVLAQSLERNLQLVTGHHLVMVHMLQPAGVQPLFAETAQGLDDVYRHLGGHLLWHDLREFGQRLQQKGIGFSLLPEDRYALEVISQYLNAKRRQLL